MSGSTVVNDYTLSSGNLTVGVGTTYNTLVVTPGFDNIYDYGTINNLDVIVIEAPVDIYVEAGSTLNGGLIRDSNGDNAIINNYGTESFVTLSVGAYERNYGFENGDTLLNGGQINVDGGISTRISVESGGQFNLNSGTLSYSTEEPGGIIDNNGGTEIDNDILLGATEYVGGLDINPTILGTSILYNSIGSYPAGTLSGVFIEGGHITVQSGATLDSMIDFDNTSGGVLSLSSTATVLSGTSIEQFVPGDTIFVGGATDFTYDAAMGTFTAGSFTLNISLQPGEILVGATTSSGLDITAETAPCFAAGTRILTVDGERCVEDLGVGDVVINKDGEDREIVWIGYRNVNLKRHPYPEQARPIRFDADCIAEGVPNVDLIVSPDHALYIDGYLIPAKALVNGQSVVQIAPAKVTYYHIELKAHDIIFAHNVPSETFLRVGDNRADFENGGGSANLHPDFSRAALEAVRAGESCAPFADEGSHIASDVRLRMAKRCANRRSAQMRYA